MLNKDKLGKNFLNGETLNVNSKKYKHVHIWKEHSLKCKQKLNCVT